MIRKDHPQLARRADDPAPNLAQLPTELLAHIFCLAASFPDVFALAATCRRLHSVWTQHTPRIYTPVAWRSLACEPLARQLLAHQGGPPPDAALAARDVARLVRNAAVVDRAIRDFERSTVARWAYVPSLQHHAHVHLDGDGEADGASGTRPVGKAHPPWLSRAERRRFARAYYRLWSLLRVGVAEQPRLLRGLAVRELLLLWEMCRLRQSVGGEEEADAAAAGVAWPPPLCERGDADDAEEAGGLVWTAAWIGTPHRHRPGVHVLRELKDAVRRHAAFGFPGLPWAQEGSAWMLEARSSPDAFLVLWDHFQPALWKYLLGRSADTVLTEPLTDYEKAHIWDEITDDET